MRLCFKNFLGAATDFPRASKLAQRVGAIPPLTRGQGKRKKSQGISTSRAQRKPKSSPYPEAGSSLKRDDTRTDMGTLRQDPPRRTRY